MKTTEELKHEFWWARALLMASNWAMQMFFTVYSALVLIVITAPVYLWVVWAGFVAVGWAHFFFHRSDVKRASAYQRRLEEEKQRAQDDLDFTVKYSVRLATENKDLREQVKATDAKPVKRSRA